MSPLRLRQRLGFHSSYSRLGALWVGLLFYGTVLGAPATVLTLAAVEACTPDALQVQARATNAFALAANRGLPTLTGAYDREGAAAIDAAPDRATAEAALVAVRARWRPVWGVDARGQPCTGEPSAGACRDGAWPALRAAEDAWAVALEQQIAGTPLDLATAARLGQQLRAAYCGLRGALPAGVTPPDLPAGASCGGSGGAAP